jgi:predicted nucleic acid-binding Zn ribbon protein
MVGAPSFLWLGWIGFAVGAAVAVWAFRGRLAKHPFCARCGHTVPPDGGSQGQTCSECGRVFSRPNHIRRRRRHPLLGSIALLLGLAGVVVTSGERVWNAFLHVVLPPYRVASTYSAAWGSVRISEPRWPDEEFLHLTEVFVGDTPRYQVRLMHPTVGEVRVLETNPPTAGEQSPTFVDYLWITESPGGSGGYSTTYVFRSPASGELVPAITLENGIFVDSHWLQSDMTYRYWLTSGAGSPVPTLAGIPSEAGIHWLDPKPTDGPSRDELDSLAKAIASASPDEQPGDQFLGPTLHGFLDLMYSGRAPEAWKFLDTCLDAGLGRFIESGVVSDMPRSREALRAVLVEKMRSSPYFAEVLRRNHGSIDPPER